MKKYIAIENELFEATLILSTTKTNDEFVPVNRKIGIGGDKNHYFVGSEFLQEFGTFFPLILKDKKDNISNRHVEKIKNYFSISNIFNDLDFINNEIDKNYVKDSKIDSNALIKSISLLAKQQNLKTNFYIESELGSAGNGIGFKNWQSAYSTIIKPLLLHTTKTNIYLYKKGEEICSYFEFNQFYETNNSVNVQKTQIANRVIQKIFYGAPGTGKSHKVNEFIKGKENRTERVTFHPEYDYNSFVGGYKPTMKDKDIRYEFVPQTFTNVYVNAWNDLDNDYFLVIEEINRGNCAEIFGDIFQLLDRSNQYEITPSKELGEYLREHLSSNVQNNGKKLLLPPNLNILATMNTSDQSLFPMDSAFKRRWDWEYLPINYDSTYIDHLGEVKKNESYTYRVEISNNQSVSWLDFIKAVNELIKSNDNLGMDKCIGNYFIKSQNAIIDLETFINKAIFYLWNDVFKDEPDEYSIFKNKTTYEDFFPIQTLGVEKVSELMDILQVKIISKSE
jgi:hypothetical protein